MARCLNNIYHDKIREQGHWTFNTFLMYIHKQISAFSAGLAMKMSTEIGWHNIDGPMLTEPAAAALSPFKITTLFVTLISFHT
jgi:hypothetical protein